MPTVQSLARSFDVKAFTALPPPAPNVRGKGTSCAHAQDVPLTKRLGATQVHQPAQDGKDLAKRDALGMALPVNEATTCCIRTVTEVLGELKCRDACLGPELAG